MYLSTNDRRRINFILLAVVVIGICFCVAPVTAAYLITEQDNIPTEVKQYYIEGAFEYFDDHKEAYEVSIDILVKGGYVKVMDDIKPCKRYGTYVSRNNDVYNLHLSCEGFSSDFTVKRRLDL